MDLLSLGGVVKIGATRHGASIPLLHNPPDQIGADLEALDQARDNYEDAKTLLSDKRRVVNSILKSARSQLMLGRDILKPTLGTRASEKWDRLNMGGSLSIPRSVVKVEATLQSFKDYFAAKPDLEDEDHDVTSARYGALKDQLLEARGNVNLQAKDTTDLLKIRDEKAEQLRNRIHSVISELNDRLPPLDSRWTAFGLNKPGAAEKPEVPQGVTVTLLGPTAAAVKWTAATRAAHYRVWKRVIGTDEQFVAAGSPADVDFTLESLPSGATIEIAVSAVNDGGESALSEKVTIVTP
jgi:hypothetical protein